MTGPLADWGWDEGWSEAWEKAPRAPGQRPARVLEEHRDLWGVTSEAGFHQGVPRKGVARPSVGDWVAISDGGPEGRVWIEELLPRRTRFSRGAAGKPGVEQVVAANLDVVFVIHGLDAEVNERRLERYLTLAWESGARPVVVLTKADLAEDAEEARARVRTVAPGVPVRVVSSRGSQGRDELAPDLRPGETVGFLGPSGVGKSTLVNALLGEDHLPTAAVREVDRKGRHTTTRRELVRLGNGTLVVDTPGMRELQVWTAESGLGQAFPDIEELSGACRFRDCSHRSEPGCAVAEAVTLGTLGEDRLRSYHKLQAEAEWQARRSDPRARREETARIKTVHKSVKAHLKRKGAEP